ncbi:torsin-1A-like isoform X1 [Paramisgurnus dabryanus]|uniref:torsin-1A-like isoform X1 n=1 Tax=Paramisgurnus dabryanus TaxID=90735 RepID=UPI0031F409E0
MKSKDIFVLFFLLPIVTVESGFLDFINVFRDKDNLRPFDAKEFGKDLRNSLYGQDIALKMIQKSVSWFIKDSNPSKPLVLSLHGPTGVGKTYVTKIIARNIYEMGEKSQHVHTFIATYHFPLKAQVKIYEAQLKQWILGNVSSFPRSMFIFDETEKMNSRLIDTIKHFLDYVPKVDGVSFHNAIFIFISQTGGNVINKLAVDYWRKGEETEELHINTNGMESEIQDIFKDKSSGFWQSCLIESHLVDHFIPFLPLKLKDVRKCVLDEMVKRNIPINRNLADKVAGNMKYFPPEEKIFSVTGCKSVKQKLVLYTHDTDTL